MKRFKEIVNFLRTDKYFDVCLGLVVGGAIAMISGIAYHKDVPTIVGGLALTGGIIGLAIH